MRVLEVTQSGTSLETEQQGDQMLMKVVTSQLLRSSSYAGSQRDKGSERHSEPMLQEENYREEEEKCATEQ